MYSVHNLPRQLNQFLHPFRNERPYEELAARLRVSGLHACGGGDTGMSGAKSDTINVREPLGLRILHWNLQDLGGGPSRGAKRDDLSIARIAKIIAECDPDVIVILEVKRYGRLPKEPVELTTTKMNLRKSKSQQPPDFEARAKAEYKRKLDRYRKEKAAYDEVTSNAGVASGILELERIEEQLNLLRPGCWKSIHHTQEQMFTHGETYGVLIRTDLFCNKSFEIDSNDFWTKNDLRAPGLIGLELFNGHKLNIIAFHAPAPNHGEVTHAAMRELANIRGIPEFVLCSDTNLSTEDERPQVKEDAERTWHEALVPKFNFTETAINLEVAATFTGTCIYQDSQGEYGRREVEGVNIVCTGEFIKEDWASLGTVTAAHYKGRYIGVVELEADVLQVDDVDLIGTFTDICPLDEETEDFFTELAKLAKSGSDFYEEPSVSQGGVTGATSLRKKVTAVGLPANGVFSDTQVFNFNAYDKVDHFLSDVAVTQQFRRMGTYVYPLFERCLSPSLLKQFEQCFIDRQDVREEIAKETQGSKVASIQGALDAANLVSDHVPMVLDLLILDDAYKIQHVAEVSMQSSPQNDFGEVEMGDYFAGISDGYDSGADSDWEPEGNLNKPSKKIHKKEKNGEKKSADKEDATSKKTKPGKSSKKK